jgi:hypothetical protein
VAAHRLPQSRRVAPRSRTVPLPHRFLVVYRVVSSSS